MGSSREDAMTQRTATSSDTPRTDALAEIVYDTAAEQEAGLREFARQLERELAEKDVATRTALICSDVWRERALKAESTPSAIAGSEGQEPCAWRYRVDSAPAVDWLYARFAPTNLDKRLKWEIEPMYPLPWQSAPAVVAEIDYSKHEGRFEGDITIPRKLLAEAYRGLKLNYEMPEVRREIDRLMSAPSGVAESQFENADYGRGYRAGTEDAIEECAGICEEHAMQANGLDEFHAQHAHEMDAKRIRLLKNRSTQGAQSIPRSGPSEVDQGPAASDDKRDAYYELLYAVARKFPGETRHQTALRYIQQAENQPDNRAMNARVDKEKQ